MTFWSLTNSDFPTNRTFHHFIPSLTFTDYEWFLWSICNGCGMPAGNAYHSGHLVPSPFWGACMCSDCWDSFPDSSPIKWPTEVDFYRIERFPWSICDRCGMPAGSAYPSGHLVPSPFWDLLMLQLLRPNYSNLPCLYSTFHLEYPLVLSRFCLKGIGNTCITRSF